ncbi:MAG: hypothetical protein EAZ90_08265 [Oscillatoriales cyanobacterium]|nr:MAG: hypothetical protein EAZ94_09865 [Oscillatoriales cyanobacterium]TAE25355.1 MAG: hypothetical protein EAZ93_10830 [Oscillatoriales cyanobacterium]TAE43890.1 MAG: hypothetical protein EAZ90_08265 [Oscillatoriales cyanobacterium]TAE65875.1 MAG: hypothetical protein EAZ86_22895 [Oscillatoriales cyanobacterium]TAF56129.1 MAG: hypothetical protein EAZ61_03620 [Oscillatoriales cyanobacterium]
MVVAVARRSIAAEGGATPIHSSSCEFKTILEMATTSTIIQKFCDRNKFFIDHFIFIKILVNPFL